MEKLMSLEHLSSIKGAQSSQAVEELFNTIKHASIAQGDKNATLQHVANPADLRTDEVCLSSEKTRNQIVKNFPKAKNNYLVVPKVIEG